MPRRPRIFVDGATYHVYCRTGRHDPVFREAQVARAFIGFLAEVKRVHGFTVLAWCVMPTHYHLVLRTGFVPLWRSMRLVQGRFAKAYNRRHGVDGAVWQGRYKAKLILGERHLQQAILYVHANPVAAGLAKSPLTYRWSGHREAAAHLANGLLDVDELLAAFGGSREDAMATYRHALKGSAASSQGEEPDRLPWWTRSAREGELDLAAGQPRVDAQGASRADGTVPRADEFVALVAPLLDTTLAHLTGRRSGRELTRCREALSVVGVEEVGLRVTELAEAIDRTPGVVSRWVAAAANRRRTDPSFGERVERLAARVRRGAHGNEHVATEAFLGGDSTFID